MTSASPQKPPGTNLSPRFRKPEIAVAERIDQLTLAHPDEQDLRQSREQQASWLKRAMAIHWNGDLPQPLIGVRPGRGAIRGRMAIGHGMPHADHRRREPQGSVRSMVPRRVGPGTA